MTRYLIYVLAAIVFLSRSGLYLFHWVRVRRRWDDAVMALVFLFLAASYGVYAFEADFTELDPVSTLMDVVVILIISVSFFTDAYKVIRDGRHGRS